MKDLLFEIAIMVVTLAAFMTYGMVCVVNDFWGAMLCISIIAITTFVVLPEFIVDDEEA